MARPVSQQTSDIMLRGFPLSVLQCVWEEDGCYHDLWIGQQFPTGQRRQEWLDRGMQLGFFCFGGLYRKEREDDRRREFKENKEINLHQPLAKEKSTRRKETDVKRQDAQRSSVFTLSILSVSASFSIVFISDTAGNPSMTHRSLKCCEPG